LPKIKIKLPPGYPEEEAFDLEEARDRLNFERGVIAVDGQRVPSYDELVKMTSQDKYKNKEYIEVNCGITDWRLVFFYSGISHHTKC
jgi:hypothetical protein